MKITEKNMNQIRKESEEAIVKLSEGKTAVEIAADIYCKNLPDKSVEAGMVMAKRMDSVICDYENNVQEAAENTEAWVNSQIDKLLKGKDQEDRCRTLFHMLIGISSLEDVISGKRTIDEIQAEYSFEVGYVSDDYEKSLKEQLKEAAMASTYGGYLLQEIDGSDMTVEDIINCGVHEHDVKVIMAMVAYTGMQNGTIDDLETDANADEVAIAVASAYDAEKVAQQMEEGTITSEKASKIIKVIGTVAAVMLTSIVTVTAVALTGLPILILLPNIIALPIMAAVAVVVWKTFYENAKSVADELTKLGMKVVKGGYELAKKGAKKLLEFMFQTVIPAATKVWEKIKAYFNKLKEEYSEEHQEEEVVVQE